VTSIEALIDPSQPGVTNDQRINRPVFRDDEFMGNQFFVNKALKVLRTNNQWQSYDLSSVIPETLTESYGLQ
jgi:hypothetical protein